jgi:putative serine protease PepD
MKYRSHDRRFRLGAHEVPANVGRMRRRLPASVLVVSVLLIVAVFVVPALGGDEASNPLAAPTDRTAGGFQETVARALPSVVLIERPGALGSGVVLDDGGHVVTNAHVVGDARTFTVTTSDGAKHTATLSGAFPEGDLAVIDVHGAKLQPATFADSSQVKVGELALAIGNPLGLQSSVTEGIVSSTSRTEPEGNGVALPSLIQTSAPINPGNSGGALVDETGAVIGIPTLNAGSNGQPAPGIGFAISSNTVTSIARELADHGEVSDSPRAWLGVDVRSVPQGGLFVAAVVRGGPAADAGIRPGDMIARVAGKPVPTVDDLAVTVAERKPGDRVPVDLRTQTGARTVQVTLGHTPPA